MYLRTCINLIIHLHGLLKIYCFFFALALYLYILSGNEMAQKFVVSYYGAIFWFMYDYSNNLWTHKNAKQGLEKFLPTQDGKEHDSCDALQIVF